MGAGNRHDSACRPLPEYKRPLTFEVCGENGEFLYAYRLFSRWVTEYRARASPDPDSPEVSVERLRLGFEEWQRDPPEKEYAGGGGF